ncbi:hypothetical protein [Streptomyces sp. NBC_00687]|uniref:hypothetical protein n=1 Tax=Streptomyces sp. NBC_00687 TaxID=2975807 RepID=UPI00225A068F|nr:hypothetical protein [Streptomyces sp. NBC_00687]MCX4919940.1 hypothetical protein [Streptomyces sp. NBC_00687]
MGATQTVGGVISYVGLLLKATAYGIRAGNTRRAVERLKARFEDRGASAKYLSEAMSRLTVDEPTTTAYMEVFTLSEVMASNVGAIVSHADALSTNAQGLAEATEAEHGRMADANRTHHVPMADAQFIKRT